MRSAARGPARRSSSRTTRPLSRWTASSSTPTSSPVSRRPEAAAGDDYVNILGADIARQCLELGELDEVLAIIAPVLLGDGTPLFHHPGGRQVRLERISAETAPLATNVWMRVVR